MNSMTEITIQDDVRVSVPDSIDLMTPFILREQEDWFEDEIKFLRLLLLPGSKVVDIGANYGLYTLSMAKTIGNIGKLWAIEPYTPTYDCLSSSIKKNKFDWVVAIKCALSDREGVANLQIESNSELNSLTTNIQAISGKSEEVRLTSLDKLSEENGISDIDFIKIDAEGEESRILAGSKIFFNDNSPLVMFELKHGSKVNLSLFDDFLGLGMEIFRLLPGINILVPFSRDDSADGYLLNLFACNKARKLELIKRDFLIDSEGIQDIDTNVILINKLNIQSLSDSRFCQSMLGDWRHYLESDLNQESVVSAIAMYYMAQDDKQSAAFRYTALNKAFDIMANEFNSSKDIYHLSTLIRIALAMGARSQAVKAVQIALQTIMEITELEKPLIPFLPAIKEFDDIQPGEKLSDWMYSYFITAFESKTYFSSYFASKKSLKNLNVLKSLGFIHPEMERRRQLLGLRYRMRANPESSSLLSEYSESNLNPDFWSFNRT